MSLHESGEDYLEAILVLKEEKGLVRSVDVAQHLGFSKPSVSRAMTILRGDGYITVSHEGYLELTESGQAVAEKIYDRHKFLTRWLVRLGVDRKTAAADACRMEHVISAESFERLKLHAEREPNPEFPEGTK